MTYEIEIEDSILVVTYYGIIDGLVILEQLQDERFLPLLKKYQKTIYDYTHVQTLNLQSEDFRTFAKIAVSTSHLFERIDSAVVLGTAMREHIAREYKNAIEGKTDWKVAICLSKDEAFQALQLIK